MNDFNFEKNKRKNYSKNEPFFLLILIIIFNFIQTDIKQCSEEEPILISGQCKLEYCSKELFDLKKCIINNTKIKTQWINNLIIFGDRSYRYISYGIYSNEDLVIETTCFPQQPKRMFYGIKKNGRPFFKNKINNEYTPFYSKNISGDKNLSLESTGAIIKLSNNENNGKEYYLSLSKMQGNAELFDFENDEVYVKKIEEFTTMIGIYSLSHTFFSLSSIEQEYYYIFGFLSYHEFINKIYLQKHIFNSLKDFEKTNTYTNKGVSEGIAMGYEVSCFLSLMGFINCFTLIKKDNKPFYSFIRFNNDFSNKKIHQIESNADEESFYKCIHLEGEVGVYAYYYNQEGNINPVILFREFKIKNDQYEYYLSSEYTASGIMISKNNFLNNFLLNDIIRIGDKKIVFTATVEDKETLYIILINIFGESEKKLKIRYYSIKLFALYHYKILFDLKLINYKNFITLGLSFCNNTNCSRDEDEHYAGLIIFNYPNSTDTKFYLDKNLFKNNINMSDIEIDLKNQLNFENNIFGYIFSSILINDIIGCDKYKLFSSKNHLNEMTKNNSLGKDEKIKIKYKEEDNIYPTLDCKIEYSFIATEPELEIYNSYTEDDEGVNEDDLFDKKEYVGRLTYYYIKLEKELTTLCEKNCDLCLKELINNCITCKYNFSFYDENTKICYEENLEIPTTEITETIFYSDEGNKNKYMCQNEIIINNNCIYTFVGEEQFEELYKQIKDYFFKNNYTENNTIIQTQNVIFQITKLKDQENSNNPNISSVDLGECKERLKVHYEIIEDFLIIYKIDIKNSDLTKTYVEYEIYDARNLTFLNLSVCNDLKISINAPVALNDLTSSLYDNMKKSGYNLFNQSDSFYNDICATYTTENGTDITLSDRKKVLYNNYGNISLCQRGCDLEYYNSTSKKINCKCYPQSNEIKINLTSFVDALNLNFIVYNFMSSLKNSNFLVLKCYKLAIELINIGKNIGRIIMTLIIFISFIFFLIFCFYDFKKINGYIKSFHNLKVNFRRKIRCNTRISSKKAITKMLSPKKSSKTINYKTEPDKFAINITRNKRKNTTKISNTKIKKLKFAPPKREGSIYKNGSPIKNKKIGYKISSKKHLEDHYKSSKNNKNLHIDNEDSHVKIVNFTNLGINKLNPNRSSKKLKTQVIKHKPTNKSVSFHQNNNKNDKIKHNYQNLNDRELNTLEYKQALLIDKRTYFQYYWSLLKKNQLLLFTFFSKNDYNLVSVKICLFLLTFSLYFTINGFFFSDNTMHKIYVDRGEYNIIFQIPQMLYSTAISIFINMLLKQLSLSEKNILVIKQENNIRRIAELSKKIRKWLIFKFIIFFILNFLLLFFFWYFISCFCAVYTNTQTILLKDTLISFTLSMLYPFGKNIIPGLFRIPALRAKNKDKQILYKISHILSLL